MRLGITISSKLDCSALDFHYICTKRSDMKKNLFVLCFLAYMPIVSAQISFTGNTRDIVTVEPDPGTGLDAIYVLHDIESTAVSYTSPVGGSNAKWYSYKEQGGAYATELTNVEHVGNASTLRQIEGNCGYIIEDGAERYYFWVVNYANYRFELRSVGFPEEQDCGLATLEFDADCDPITYYTITGVPKTLERGIHLYYTTLVWDEENSVYAELETDMILDQINARTVVQAPLCNTTFSVEGDRFLEAWGEAVGYTTDTYVTKSIEVKTEAVQAERDNANEQKEESENLGGSAPVDISFRSYCTDAVAHKEWQFSRDPEFAAIELRFNEDDLDYSFREDGTYYVKFVASNSDASCSTESDVYTITVGESALQCPNAFSPNASPGINDEWKVSYKSIVSFRCWIFDRYGTQIFSFEDPAAGWDGKYKGKFVKAGVYYYVIEATGADGKEYKLKGDINILKSTGDDNNTTN